MFSSDDILNQINLKEVDKSIYEIKITCGKVANTGFSLNKKKSQMGTRLYKVKRPLKGTMKVSMFCMFCEKNYNLRVTSVRNQTRKSYWSILWFSFFLMGFDFYYDLEMIWIMILFPLYYIFLKFRTSFADSNKNHETRFIREFERIDVKIE